MGVSIDIKKLQAMIQRVLPMLMQMGMDKERAAMYLASEMKKIKAREAAEGRLMMGREESAGRRGREETGQQLLSDLSEMIMGGSGEQPYPAQHYAGLLKEMVPEEYTGGITVPEGAGTDIAGAQQAAREYLAALMSEDPKRGEEQILSTLSEMIKGYGFDTAAGGVEALEKKKSDVADRELTAAGLESRAATAKGQQAVTREGLVEKGKERERLTAKDVAEVIGEEPEEDSMEAKLAKIEEVVSILVNQYGYSEKDARKKAEAYILGKK